MGLGKTTVTITGDASTDAYEAEGKLVWETRSYVCGNKSLAKTGRCIMARIL